MRSDHGAGVPESTTFAQTLSELKREGANLLLVGEATPAAHAAASRRLLADAEESDHERRRLFVLTKGADVCGDLAPPDPATARIVSQESGGTTPTPADWPDVEESSVDAELLSPLAMATIDAIEALDEDAGGLEPAQLRAYFDSVTALLRDHQSENVFRLLHLVTTRVRQVNGMGHYHLRIDRDSDPVRLLEPMFDAVVEMRVEDGDVQQRWHLRDREVTSEWTSMDPD